MRYNLTKYTSWVLVIVLSMALGGAAVVGIDSLKSSGGSNQATAVFQQAAPATSAAVAQQAPEDVSDLYQQVRPSIVRITGQSARGSGGGLGSGIVLDKQGHILTNNHVIKGFDQLDVTFADGTSVSAKVVGTDPGNDLALVQVNVSENELKPATLGDSDKVRIGEFVIAVGNPFGLDGSLTSGIISGVGRTQPGSGNGRPLRQLLQSDAAINPGNSGGALFNRRGEVIGVTEAIENPTGESVFAGIGYSVPINAARRFLPDLLAGKTVLHPRLGVGLQQVTPALAKTLGLNIDQGVMIISVDSSSAASRAGLRAGPSARNGTPGDVVVSIDGNQIKTFDDLANYLDTKNVGDKIQLKLVRDGKEMTIDVTLDAWQG